MTPAPIIRPLALSLFVAGTAAACQDDSMRVRDGEALRPPVVATMAKGGNGGKGGGGGGGGGDGPFPATATILAASNLYDDGRGAYVDGECGVQAEVGSTLALFKPAGRNLKGKERNCGGRYAIVTLTTRHLAADPADHSQDVGVSESWDLISIKTRLDRGPSAPMTVNVGRCDTGLELDPDEIPGSSSVNVTVNGESTHWLIETRAYPDNVAGCLLGGTTELFHLEVSFEMTRN